MSPKKKKNAVRCCVSGCKNTSENSPALKLYRFPNANFHTYKKERRENWISFVRQTKPGCSLWQPHEASRICSQHFVGNIKTENPLNPNYNPSILPAEYHKFIVPVTFLTPATKRFKKGIEHKNLGINETSCGNSSGEFHPETYKKTFRQDLTFNGVHYRDNEIKRTADQETQIDIMDDESIDKTCQIFICNRYIYSNLQNCHTCDVEVQVYIPDIDNCGKFIVKKFFNETENCRVIIEHNTVGTDTYDRDDLLKNKMGFKIMSSIKNDQEMLDFAGVTLHSYQLLLNILPPSEENEIPKEKSLLIFLLKMKHGLAFSALSVLFGIDRSKIPKIFVSTLQYLAEAMKDFVFWPNRDIVQATMPQMFQESYNDCRVIIDCMELRVEQPSVVKSRVHIYSRNTERLDLKFIAGFTPSGAISFISNCHGGRTTDAQINDGGGFVELIESGDIVLANKRFPQIEKMLDETGRGIFILIPPSLHNNTDSSEIFNVTDKLACIRIHIKRILQRLRSYRILNKFTLKMLPHCDDIVFMCCVLINLQQPIIKKKW